MGQVALGLQSLALRLAVFVVMAALLAWALGGTLFPSPQRVNFPAWEFGGSQWNWRVTGSSTIAGPTTWTLFERRGDASAVEQRFGIDGPWRTVWGPRFDGHSMVLGLASEAARKGPPAPRWWLLRFDPPPSRHVETTSFASEAALIAALGAAGETMEEPSASNAPPK
jgi:hypothetical protein